MTREIELLRFWGFCICFKCYFCCFPTLTYLYLFQIACGVSNECCIPCILIINVQLLKYFTYSFSNYQNTKNKFHTVLLMQTDTHKQIKHPHSKLLFHAIEDVYIIPLCKRGELSPPSSKLLLPVSCSSPQTSIDASGGREGSAPLYGLFPGHCLRHHHGQLLSAVPPQNHYLL